MITKSGRILFCFCIGIFFSPYVLASTDVEVFETYFLGDKYERHYSKETGKLVASFFEDNQFENPLSINFYEDPELLDIYLSSMADNFRLFDLNFFNHPQETRITSIKQWVSYRLKYHLEKTVKKHFMGDNARELSSNGKNEIKRIADSIPNQVVKNIFLHSLLDRVFRLQFQSPEYYLILSQFLKEIGYDYSPPGFIGTGHCQILRRSQSAVNYCFDDKSVLEKHLQIQNINSDKFPSHIAEIRKRNSLILEIFEASLMGLGLRLDQVICEDFDSRVYTTAQAGIPRRYYYRSIFSNQVYADYFLVDKYLAKFLMGNTEDFNTFKAHRGGFYSSISQGEKELKLNLSSEDARQAFAKCVEEEVEYYQEK